MAHNSPLHYHQPLSLFVVLQILIIYFSCYNCYAQSLESEKVDVSLYYESLCPYCSYFIAHDLVTIFTNGLSSIVNLRFIPWGNAAIDSSGNFQCQHGSGECLLNTVEACAIDVYHNPNKQYFLIQCIESLTYQGKEAEWQTCFTQTSLDPQPLYDCYNKGVGRRLEVQYSYQTSQLNPPHSYVPWVLVNNQPLGEDYQNFIAYICRAYKGRSVPTICRSSQLEINTFSEDRADQMGCFVGNQKNLTSFTPTQIVEQSRRIFSQGSNRR